MSSLRTEFGFSVVFFFSAISAIFAILAASLGLIHIQMLTILSSSVILLSISRRRTSSGTDDAIVVNCCPVSVIRKVFL